MISISARFRDSKVHATSEVYVAVHSLLGRTRSPKYWILSVKEERIRGLL